MFGHDHPDVAKSYWGIGNVLLSQGKYEEALQKYQNCLDIQTRVYGQDHPDVATSVVNMAVVYAKQGNQVQFKQLIKQGYGIRLRSLGPEHPETQKLKSFVDE